jgi:hypothetical protein
MHDTRADRAFDHRLFAAVAVLFPLVVLIGFAPTYYARFWFDAPPLSSAVVQMHGAVMTLWVLLFCIQVTLVSVHRVRVHQRLGWIGVALGVAIVCVGTVTALRAGKYGAPSTPPGIAPLAFMIVPTFDLLMFVLFFSAAIYYRRKPTLHKPLMLLTAINFLPPAVARIGVPTLQALGPLWFFGFPTAVALLCVAVDARRKGRVNRVLLGGTALLVASYIARLTLMTSSAWMRVATWATQFV